MDIEDKVILKTVQETIDEIGHKLSLPSVRTIALLVRGTIRRVIRGIYLEKSGLEKVQIYLLFFGFNISIIRTYTHMYIIIPSNLH